MLVGGSVGSMSVLEGAWVCRNTATAVFRQGSKYSGGGVVYIKGSLGTLTVSCGIPT